MSSLVAAATTGRVIVVGAGISGLAAASEIARLAPRFEVTVLEGAHRIGGKLAVSEVGGVAVDEGAEAMLVRAPEGIALARDVGLDRELRYPAVSAADLLLDGVLVPVPQRTLLGVPTDAESVTAVLDSATLARLRDEPHRPGPALTDDVSVADLIGDRLGAEVVDRLVEPLLGGVYAGRAAVLSVRATMPALARGLADQPSVVTAARRAVHAAPPGAGPAFATLAGGLGTLPGALAKAGDARIALGVPVRELRLTGAGGGFELESGPVPHPVLHRADAVVLAVPGAKAAGILRALCPAAANELAGIEYASTALITLAFPPGTPVPPGSGILVPAGSGYAVKALTFSSTKWAHLAGGPVIVRASVGRHGEEAALHRDDTGLAALVRTEIAAITGIHAAPIDRRVTRWGGALPQYAVGHLDRVERIRAEVARVPGLAVCGAAYGGVGVPACIHTGQLAAARVVDHLMARSARR